MKKVQNEIKIGLTIVIAMLMAVIGFRLMQDVPLFRPSLQLYTYFTQVDGVNPGTSVYISGVKIGSVNRVSLVGPDSVQVVMNLSYTEGIPVGSQAFIEPADLIGTKRVRIVHSGRDEMIPDGGFIKGIYDEGGFADLQAFADDIKPDVERTTSYLAGVLGHVDDLLAEGGKEDIRQTLGSLSQSSEQINRLLQARSADLDVAIVHLKSMMASLDTLSADTRHPFEEILGQLQETSRELVVVSRELGGVSTELHVMMKQINTGEGTIGRLIQDPSLYQNLDSLAINLKNITRILEEDPRHFLKHMRLVDIF